MGPAGWYGPFLDVLCRGELSEGSVLLRHLYFTNAAPSPILISLCLRHGQGLWVIMMAILCACHLTILHLHPHRSIPCPFLPTHQNYPSPPPPPPQRLHPRVVCGVQAHEDRNLARKLTPAEKKEKKLKKLVGEANEGDSPEVALYKVMDLSNRQHQFKVRVNAQVSFHLLSKLFVHACWVPQASHAAYCWGCCAASMVVAGVLKQLMMEATKLNIRSYDLFWLIPDAFLQD